jgi:hypothetical protein
VSIVRVEKVTKLYYLGDPVKALHEASLSV